VHDVPHVSRKLAVVGLVQGGEVRGQGGVDGGGLRCAVRLQISKALADTGADTVSASAVEAMLPLGIIVPGFGGTLGQGADGVGEVGRHLDCDLHVDRSADDAVIRAVIAGGVAVITEVELRHGLPEVADPRSSGLGGRLGVAERVVDAGGVGVGHGGSGEVVLGEQRGGLFSGSGRLGLGRVVGCEVQEALDAADYVVGCGGVHGSSFLWWWRGSRR